MVRYQRDRPGELIFVGALGLVGELDLGMGQRNTGPGADIGADRGGQPAEPPEAVERQHVVAVAELEMPEDITVPAGAGRRASISLA